MNAAGEGKRTRRVPQACRRRWPSCPSSSQPTTRRPTSRPWRRRPSAHCPPWPSASRSSPSTTAHATARRPLPMTWRKRHPDVFRVVHHPTNLGYGAALRSGFRAARFGLIAFTDGDRQFKVADVGRLTERLAAPDSPDVVVGYRLKRADPPIRRWYARIYRLSNRIFFGVRVQRHRLRLQALPAGGPRRRSASRPAGPSSPPSCWSSSASRAAGWPRSECRTTRARPARPPGPSRVSSSGPCGTSGRCGCACGSRGAGRCGEASRSSGDPSCRAESDLRRYSRGGSGEPGPSRWPSSRSTSRELTNSRKTSSFSSI